MTFTQGYQPESHLNSILGSLCKSCDFDFNYIQKLSTQINNISENKSIEELINSYKDNPKLSIEDINISEIIAFDNYYTRLQGIGLFELMNKNCTIGTEEYKNKLSIITKALGYSISRVEKE